MNQTNNKNKKTNRIPYSVEFTRLKKQFAHSLLSPDREDQVYLFRKLSKFLDLQTYHQVGDAWRDCYTDPDAINRTINLVESLDTSR